MTHWISQFCQNIFQKAMWGRWGKILFPQYFRLRRCLFQHGNKSHPQFSRRCGFWWIRKQNIRNEFLGVSGRSLKSAAHTHKGEIQFDSHKVFQTADLRGTIMFSKFHWKEMEYERRFQSMRQRFFGAGKMVITWNENHGSKSYHLSDRFLQLFG